MRYININLNNSINFDVYNSCFIDYVSGKMPFLFVNYGILYPDLLYFGKFYVEFSNFIFEYVVSEQNQTKIDHAINFLIETGLTIDEIKERIAQKLMEV